MAIVLEFVVALKPPFGFTTPTVLLHDAPCCRLVLSLVSQKFLEAAPSIDCGFGNAEVSLFQFLIALVCDFQSLLSSIVRTNG